MTSLTAPIVVLDDAPKHLGLSSVRKPFSSKWSKKGGGQLVVSSTARFLREMPTGVVHRLKDRLLLLSQIEQPALESVERLFDAVVVAEPSEDLLEILSAKIVTSCSCVHPMIRWRTTWSFIVATCQRSSCH